MVSTTGIYRDTLHFVTGCDSVRRIINLIFTPANISSITASICSDAKYTLPWGAIINTSGIYIDTVKTAFGCDSLVRKVSLTVLPIPAIKISKSNDLNCAIGLSKLNVVGGRSYLWSPSIGLNDVTINNPVATPTVNTLYRVTVTAENGCKAKDSILVVFKNENPENKYFVPTAFTPNNDGLNDCFGVAYWGNINSFSFTIFNRWGQKVFSTNNILQCWDGKYNGIVQSTGTFVYQISGQGICGIINKKGTITLIR